MQRPNPASWSLFQSHSGQILVRANIHADAAVEVEIQVVGKIPDTPADFIL